MNAVGGAAYAIRVAGHLDDHWSSLLDGLTVIRETDGTTTLICLVADQAQLYGVIDGLRDIGADLIEVLAAGQPTVRPPGGSAARMGDT